MSSYPQVTAETRAIERPLGTSAPALRNRYARLTPYALLAPTLILLGATVVFPILYNFYISLFDFNLLSDPTPTDWVGFGNYLSLFSDPQFWNAMRITAAFTVVSVGLEFTLGLGLALLVHDQALPGRGLIRTILIAPILTTPIVIALVFRMMWHDEFGVLTWLLAAVGIDGIFWLAQPIPAFTAVIVTEVWQHTSFVFLVLLGAMQMLPEEPYHAARLDGADYWQRLWYITLPLLKPAILVVLVFRLVFNIRQFELVYMLTDGGPHGSTELISILIQRAAFQNYEMGYASTMSVVLTLVAALAAISIVLLIYRRGGTS